MKEDQRMKPIPAGKFFMGTGDLGEYESPIHEVFVHDFHMDIYPVTNEEFNRFVEKTGYKTGPEYRGSAMGYVDSKLRDVAGLNWKSYFTEDRKNHPVVLVSWHDAMAYAKWIGKRLPTEAEWEKAARGGLVNKLYPWGDEHPTEKLCNFGKITKNFPRTTEVMTFPPNNYGLYDMCGNVWNWCNDWFLEAPYNVEDTINPGGPESGRKKIRRGASFNIEMVFRLRTSYRGNYDPNEFSINIGFRCAKS